MADTLSVLLADDHRLMRSGIREFLELDPDLRIVGEAGDGEETLHLARELRPDVLVLDIQMPLKTGIEVTRALRAEGNPVAILILSAYDDEPFVMQALQAGANGYLLKTTEASDLIDAVRDVHAGQSALDKALIARLVQRAAQSGHPDGQAPTEPLSQREVEVLALVAKGLTNKAIGARLGISDRTVQGHIANIFAKLQAQSRTDAVMIGLRLGLILSG